MSEGRYNQVKHGAIDTSFSEGEEVHILSQDARGERMLNIRVCRVAPSKSGHVGYTKRGFYLTEEEALAFYDLLGDLLDDDTRADIFHPAGDTRTPGSDTLSGVGDE